MMFYRDVKKLAGNSYVEFESLKIFVKYSPVEEKVSWSDFRKLTFEGSKNRALIWVDLFTNQKSLVEKSSFSFLHQQEQKQQRKQ